MNNKEKIRTIISYQVDSDDVYSKALIKCRLRAPFRKDVGSGANQ